MSPLTNINLTGYQQVILANSQTNAGGVGVYVNKLNSNREDIWLRISIKIGKDSLVVGAIYRHPKRDVNKRNIDLFYALQRKITNKFVERCHLSQNLWLKMLMFSDCFYDSIYYDHYCGILFVNE